MSVAALRVWILAAALGSFAAGMAIGFLVPELSAADRGRQGAAGHYEQYARQLVERYGLSPEQERLLRMVLQEDERLENQILRDADWSEMPPALNQQRLSLKRRTEQRIRYVLDEQQRERYDQDSRPERKNR